jgi:hypothetical protein
VELTQDRVQWRFLVLVVLTFRAVLQVSSFTYINSYRSLDLETDSKTFVRLSIQPYDTTNSSKTHKCPTLSESILLSNFRCYFERFDANLQQRIYLCVRTGAVKVSCKSSVPQTEDVIDAFSFPLNLFERFLSEHSSL